MCGDAYDLEIRDHEPGGMYARGKLLIYYHKFNIYLFICINKE